MTCIIWITGIEVFSLYVDDDTGNYNDTAFSHEASLESIIIGKSNQLLMEGENIVAVHAFNNSLTSSDFFDSELASPRLSLLIRQQMLREGFYLLPPTLSPQEGTHFKGLKNSTTN